MAARMAAQAMALLAMEMDMVAAAYMVQEAVTVQATMVQAACTALAVMAVVTAGDTAHQRMEGRMVLPCMAVAAMGVVATGVVTVVTEVAVVTAA